MKTLKTFKTTLLLTLIALFLGGLLTAQDNVGIGTNTPDSGAALDIVSTDKGVLIPRVESSAVIAPALGMLIFQPSDKTFYYYDGVTWLGIGRKLIDEDRDTKIAFIEETTSGPDSVKFTLDGSELVNFTTNGNGDLMVEQLRTSGNTFYGKESGSTIEAGYNSQVTAFGYQALAKNRIGVWNTAFGYRALAETDYGNSNSAFGRNALKANSGGQQNTAIGHDALGQNAFGNGNVAVGHNGLRVNYTGSRNTAVGYAAGNNSVGSDNVFLGYQAGRNETGSDKLYISNFSGDSTEVLIYGEFDSSIVRLNGSLGIGIVPPDSNHIHIFSPDNPTIKLQSDGIDEVSGRVSMRQSNNTGFDIYYDGTTSIDDLVFEGFSSQGSAGRHMVIETTSGEVGLGISNPSHPLHLGNGAHCTSSGAWTNGSDLRLKKAIEPINYGIEELMHLNPVAYKMKATDEAQIGFIAQEVKEILPELISGIEGDVEKGETLGMSYGNLTAVLVKAVQEQQDVIESQEERIAKLEKMMEALLLSASK